MAENDGEPDGAGGERPDADAAQEPIDAEFEPAKGQSSAHASRSVSPLMAALMSAGAAVLGAIGGVVLDGGGSGGGASDVEIAGLRSEIEALNTRLAETTASDQTRADIAALEEHVDAAGARLTALEAAGASGGDEEMAAALASRMDALAAETAEATRIAREASNAPRASPADIANLSSRVATIDARSASAENRIADMDLRVSEIDARADAHEASIAQNGEAVASLAGRLTGVATAVGRRSAGAAAALAIADLQNVSDAGHPFATELVAVAEHVEDPDLLAPLSPLADDGVSSRAQLASMFGAVARQARRAERGGEGGVVDHLSRAIADVVTVRRLDAPQSQATGDILARAQARLAADDLEACVIEMERLQGPAREAADGWIVQARQRLALEAALDDIRASLANG